MKFHGSFSDNRKRYASLSKKNKNNSKRRYLGERYGSSAGKI